MSRYVLDPTSEVKASTVAMQPRPGSLAGKHVGLLDISKARGDVFLDRLAERLTEVGAVVHRYRKPTFTKPCPSDLRLKIKSECDVLVEALAD